jgi:hypothetical protein
MIQVIGRDKSELKMGERWNRPTMRSDTYSEGRNDSSVGASPGFASQFSSSSGVSNS